MPTVLAEHLKIDTSQEEEGIGRMIKQESQQSSRYPFLEEISKLSAVSPNRIQRGNHLYSFEKDLYFAGFPPATTPQQQQANFSLPPTRATDEPFPTNHLDMSDDDDDDTVPPNPQEFPESCSEDLDDELNDYYSNRTDLEELVVNEVAFDRKCGESELKITAIASADPGVVLIATDRLEIYSYDIKQGSKQLFHRFDESVFLSSNEGIRSRLRDKPMIENLLIYNPQTYILMVNGNLLRFDPTSKSIEPLIPVRQAKEQLVLEGRSRLT